MMMIIIIIIIMAIVSISIIQQLLPLLQVKRKWFTVPVCKSYHD